MPESPESEAAATIRKVRKLMAMSNVPDEDLLYYLKVVLDCRQSPAPASEEPPAVVVDAIEKAAQRPEVAQNFASIEEQVYRVDHPEEFSECEELVSSQI